jgi:hypothetical protein
MSKTYDFSKGKKGAVVPLPPGKTRITIRLDNDVIDWFRSQVEARGSGSYQAMINSALKEHVQHGGEALEALLRRVIREELQNGGSTMGLQSPR